MADIVPTRNDHSRALAARLGDLSQWTPAQAIRDLTTGSQYDRPFRPGRDLYIRVAVFDHSQTRHTRHPRPVRPSVEE
jgi:hypothetical protein